MTKVYRLNAIQCCRYQTDDTSGTQLFIWCNPRMVWSIKGELSRNFFLFEVSLLLSTSTDCKQKF